jgi:hypothetical protein
VKVWSSETSVDFEWTAWRYIPEYANLYNRRCENFSLHIFFFSFFSGEMLINLYNSSCGSSLLYPNTYALENIKRYNEREICLFICLLIE